MSLSIGSLAPDFTLMDAQGNPWTLSSHKGKKIVLYFYPKDDTPGCTSQACNLNENLEYLHAQGYIVVGISRDDEKKHQKFIEKYQLKFTLLSDPEIIAHERYNTWGEKSMYGKKYMGTLRHTYIIDEEGIILDVITKVKTKEHTKQIIKEKQSLAKKEKVKK